MSSMDGGWVGYFRRIWELRFFWRSLVMTDLRQYRSDHATQPMSRLSMTTGSKRRPMMHSVLPPPMSTTRRRPGSSCRECAKR